jgi:hypothetical protein
MVNARDCCCLLIPLQVTQSIYHALYIANQGDVDKMTDELLNLIHDPIAEARRQEEEQRKKREQEVRVLLLFVVVVVVLC